MSFFSRIKNQYGIDGIVIRFSLLAVLAYLVALYKPMVLVAAFEVLDLFKNFLKRTFSFIPLDLVFVFGITASYLYHPVFAVLIFLLGIVNRAVTFTLEARHVLKFIRHMALFTLVIFFRDYELFVAGTLMLVINYILKYSFNLFNRQVYFFEKSPFHITNFVGSMLLFYVLATLYEYFPFLL